MSINHLHQKVFKSTLANGKIIQIQSNNNGIELFENLIEESHPELINQLKNESSLSQYLSQFFTTIFPEIDIDYGLLKEYSFGDSRVDFAFKEKYEESGIVVDLSSQTRHFASNSFYDSYLVRSSSFRNQTIKLRELDLPIKKSFLIAGRSEHRSILDNIQRDEAYYAYRIITWDEVLDIINPEANETSSLIIIENIIDFSRKILKLLSIKPDIIREIDDRRFEELMATLLFDLGFQEVELTPPRKDGGKDIIAHYTNSELNRTETYYFECKHWKEGNNVTVDVAIKLLDIVKENNASGGFILTTSDFAPKLISTRAVFTQKKLYLKNYGALLSIGEVWEKTFGSFLTTRINPLEILKTEV